MTNVTKKRDKTEDICPILEPIYAYMVLVLSIFFLPATRGVNLDADSDNKLKSV